MKDRIKLARKAAGLTQDELAAKIGVTTRALQKWEAGDVEPRGRHLKQLSHATGRSMPWLVGVDEEKVVA